VRLAPPSSPAPHHTITARPRLHAAFIFASCVDVFTSRESPGTPQREQSQKRRTYERAKKETHGCAASHYSPLKMGQNRPEYAGV